jgi:hypothetical protein
VSEFLSETGKPLKIKHLYGSFNKQIPLPGLPRERVRWKNSGGGNVNGVGFSASPGVFLGFR